MPNAPQMHDQLRKPPLQCLFIALLCMAAGAARADDASAALRARYAELKDRLQQTQFQKPIHLASAEMPDSASGEIYAVIAQPFSTVGPGLERPASWCEVLILNLNVKYCRPAGEGRESTLAVSVGKKGFQPLEQALRAEFVYRLEAKTPDYLKVTLNAEHGPLGTRNYRLYFEAVPLDEAHSFIHLSYAYGYGLAGKLAMQFYLGTTGSDKAGFTIVGRESDGRPRYVGGVRGIVERNTMRYYLAIEAHLGALSSPPQARMEKGFRDWFAAAERYPRQLHEMEQGEYMDMKRREYQRQL